MQGFVIHAWPVSEGILAIASLPGRTGEYDADLTHVKDWKPALVISTTTEVEMVTAGAADFGAHLQDMGTRWAHFPVQDFGTPSRDQEDAWHELSRTALAALQGGGRVLIHCRMGRGRSGMAALRLMIEAGEPAAKALQRMRSVHPAAVETQAQKEWASTS